jgi:hypothetical protein
MSLGQMPLEMSHVVFYWNRAVGRNFDDRPLLFAGASLVCICTRDIRRAKIFSIKSAAKQRELRAYMNSMMRGDDRTNSGGRSR